MGTEHGSMARREGMNRSGGVVGTLRTGWIAKAVSPENFQLLSILDGGVTQITTITTDTTSLPPQHVLSVQEPKP